MKVNMTFICSVGMYESLDHSLATESKHLTTWALLYTCQESLSFTTVTIPDPCGKVWWLICHLFCSYCCKPLNSLASVNLLLFGLCLSLHPHGLSLSLPVPTQGFLNHFHFLQHITPFLTMEPFHFTPYWEFYSPSTSLVTSRLHTFSYSLLQ